MSYGALTVTTAPVGNLFHGVGYITVSGIQQLSQVPPLTRKDKFIRCLAIFESRDVALFTAIIVVWSPVHFLFWVDC